MKRKRCASFECTVSPSFNVRDQKKPLFCKEHKTPAMVNVKQRTCEVEGCATQPTFNVPGSKKSAFCRKHATPDMVDVKSRRCEHPDCTKVPTFNVKGTKTTKFCKAHASPDMVDVKSKRCRAPDCDMLPCFNFPGTRTPLYCKKHALHDMMDIKSKRCVEPGCDRNPCFGFRDAPSASHCKAHASPGMIDVKHRRCLEDGCDVRPSFNAVHEKVPLYCREHAKDGMVDIISRRCAVEDCDACPAFNYVGFKTGQYCKLHALPNMTDIRNAKCDERDCTTRAMFGVPAFRASRCAKHRQKGMIRYPNKRCSTFRCMRIGTHEKSSERFCETHAPEGSTNLALKPCSSCGLEDVLVDGKCDSCDPERIKAVRHLKEERIKTVLQREGISFVHDKIMDSTTCGLERPDFVIDCGSHLVILEVDENQHDTYACQCEIARMINLAQIGGLPVTFVRYNPDVYDSKQKCYSQSKRQEVLIKWLREVMAKSPVETRGAVVDVLYLFYDDYDPAKPELRTLLAADKA